MSEDQEKFDLLIEKIDECVQDEEPMMALSALTNVLVIRAINHCGDAYAAAYGLIRMQQAYIDEAIEQFNKKVAFPKNENRKATRSKTKMKN